MISYKQFSEQLLPTPHPAEQRKIAACLGSLDDLIRAEGRRLEALRSHKKGLMQQLFPRPGETRPCRRFPEFHNAGEWEEKRLGDLGTLVSGLTYSPSDVQDTGLFWNGSIPWVSAKDMKQLFLDDSEDHVSTADVNGGTKLAPADDILICVRPGA